MSIAQITDTGNHILLKADCFSVASITGTLADYGVAGVINGSATIDPNLGLLCLAGSASWTGLNQIAKLDYEGQIAFDVTTNGIAQYDNETSEPSGSTGFLKTVTAYLLTAKDIANTNTSQIAIAANNNFSARLHQSDQNFGGKINSIALGKTTTRICLYWKGSRIILNVNGQDFSSNFRANFDKPSQLNKLIFGAAWGTISSSFGYYISNIVVSRKSPRFASRQTAVSIGILGDSFATQTSSSGLPKFNAGLKWMIMTELAKVSARARIYPNGNDGKTTALIISEGKLATFAETAPTIAILLLANNDIKTDVDIALTDANIKQIIETIFYQDYPTNTQRSATRKLILATTGSIRQDTTVDTTANRARRVTADEIINAIPAWFDTTHVAEAGKVTVVDLFNLLGGDKDGNIMYQGALNVIGNGFTTPITEPNNRHPSGHGHVALANGLVGEILS